MTKKWTEDEDLHLVRYFNAVGAMIGPHDLGRSEPSTIARVKSLKRSGAWAAYLSYMAERKNALRLAGHLRDVER